MITCLTYPASLQLIRASRRDWRITLTPFEGTPEWPVAPQRPDRWASTLAYSGEEHALPTTLELPLLVGDARARTKAVGLSYRLAGKGLPASGSYVLLSRQGFADVLCESPALCVVREAERLVKARIDPGEAVLRLASLIDELCGRYARQPWADVAGTIAYDIEPVLTVAELRGFLAKATRVQGLTLARRALPLALDNLGSPMEALLEMALCNPPRFGGINLRKPVSNVPLAFTEHQRRLVSHTTLRPDLYWGAWGIASEYNGRTHEDERSSAEDDRRYADYQTCGIAMFPARWPDVSSPQGLDRYLRRVVDVAGKHEGRDWTKHVLQVLDSVKYRRARQMLLATLLPPR